MPRSLPVTARAGASDTVTSMATPDRTAPIHLRPYGASILCIVVWCILGAMAIEALFSAGLRGLTVFPGLALIAAVLWALLWAPRVVLLPGAVEVRNIWRSVHLPFSAITAVRLGAMVRFDVEDEQQHERTITAWNAPGIGRDHVTRNVDRRTVGRAGARGGDAVPHRLNQGERLDRDQRASRSAIVRDRWQAWTDAAGTRRSDALEAPEQVRTRVNTSVIAVLGVLVVLCLVNILI